MSRHLLAGLFLFASATPLFAGPFSLQPLTTFGTGGTIAAGPGYLPASGDNVRSVAHNPITGNIYLAYRLGGVPNIQVLDALTGAPAGTLKANNIVNGSAQGFRINTIDVADDGAIYAGNVVTSANTISGNNNAVRVWRYPSEQSGLTSGDNLDPVLVFSDQIVRGQRWGDSFTVRGAGANTQFLIGAGVTDPRLTIPDPNAHISPYAMLTVSDPSFAGPTALVAHAADQNPANGQTQYEDLGDLRSGIAFGEGNSFWGKGGPQTSGSIAPKNLKRGTFDAVTYAQNGVQDFPMTGLDLEMSAIDVDVSRGLLAGLVANEVAGEAAQLRLYDISNPSSLTLLQVVPLVNSNNNQFQVGDVEFGSNGVVYVLNTNNSLQAFAIVPEPGTAIAMLLGGVAVLVCRRR